MFVGIAVIGYTQMGGWLGAVYLLALPVGTLALLRGVCFLFDELPRRLDRRVLDAGGTEDDLRRLRQKWW